MNEIILAILLTNSAPNAVPPKVLSKEIMKVSTQHKVSPVLIAQIIMVESRGDGKAFNSGTKDHGLMQINELTAQDLNITNECLYNWKCNLKHGVKIIKTLKRPCAYNLGNGGSQKETRLKKCLYYEEKLAKVLLRMNEQLFIAKEQ